MKTLAYIVGLGLFLLACFSCSEIEESVPAIATKGYAIYSDDAGLTGELRINKFLSGETEVVITLAEDVTGPLPVFITTGYLVNGGVNTLRLSDIVAGQSTSTVTQLDDGTAFSFEDWLAYEGHVSIAASENDLTTIVAGGDIGVYEITTDSLRYALDSLTSARITGALTFFRRVDSTQVVEVDLDNTNATSLYTVELRSESLLESGTALLTISQPAAGVAFAPLQLSSLPPTYPTLRFNDLEDLDASLVALEDAVPVAATDIGINRLGSGFRAFGVDSVAQGGSGGRLALRQRRSGFTVAEVNQEQFVAPTIHPVEILSGDTSTTATASVIVTLNSIGPADSISFSHIELSSTSQEISYDSLLNINGHVVVRRSETDNTVIAKGNIGSN